MAVGRGRSICEPLTPTLSRREREKTGGRDLLNQGLHLFLVRSFARVSAVRHHRSASTLEGVLVGVAREIDPADREGRQGDGGGRGKKRRGGNQAIVDRPPRGLDQVVRSEERRVGKECRS